MFIEVCKTVWHHYRLEKLSSDNSVSVYVHQHVSLLLPVVVLWVIFVGGRLGGQCGGVWCKTCISQWGSNTTDSTNPDLTRTPSVDNSDMDWDGWNTALRRLDNGSVKDIRQRCITALWQFHKGSRWATVHKRMHFNTGHELLVFLPFLTFFTDCFFLMNLVASCGRSSPSPLTSGMGSIPPENHERRSSSKWLWPHLYL